jgi:hypothetical protein
VGNLAAYPAELIQTEMGRMDAYLIEARSIGGLSGSPVFVHSGTMRVISGKLSIAQEPMFYLAGLVHGHYKGGRKEVPGGVDKRNEAVNIGIAIVVPIDNILGFLDKKGIIRPKIGA